ncbi:MAG: tryptophan synthase subunit alpha [Bacteroidota bacterium]
MTRFAQMFARLQAQREKALIGYLTVGDPGFSESLARCEAALAGGVDALELGIPYSDPLADGPVIQAAGQRALAAGFRLAWLWQILRQLREDHLETPLAIMTYVNPVLQVGAEAFVARAVAEGADALIIPDLPPEEEEQMLSICRSHGLDLIPFAAPTTPYERMRRVLPGHGGFVYCVSVTGVTGSSLGNQASGMVSSSVGRHATDHPIGNPIDQLLEQAREASGLPVCLGFGISTPGDVQSFGRRADGVIVGTALVRCQTRAELGELVRTLKQATRSRSDAEGGVPAQAVVKS